jgi:hypothetical protein
MTDKIKELEEQLRIAKEEKFISEGGFRCVRCGRLLKPEYKFSESEAQPKWIIDIKSHPDPSLNQMCKRCAEDQFGSLKNQFFKDLELKPGSIEVIKVSFETPYIPAGHNDQKYYESDSYCLKELVFKVDNMYFELEMYEDQIQEYYEPRFKFIGREGEVDL